MSGDCFIIPETKDFSLSSPLGPGGNDLLSLHNHCCAFTGWSDRGIERILMSSDTRVEVGAREGGGSGGETDDHHLSPIAGG